MVQVVVQVVGVVEIPGVHHDLVVQLGRGRVVLLEEHSCHVLFVLDYVVELDNSGVPIPIEGVHLISLWVPIVVGERGAESMSQSTLLPVNSALPPHLVNVRGNEQVGSLPLVEFLS